MKNTLDGIHRLAGVTECRTHLANGPTEPRTELSSKLADRRTEESELLTKELDESHRASDGLAGTLQCRTGDCYCTRECLLEGRNQWGDCFRKSLRKGVLECRPQAGQGLGLLRHRPTVFLAHLLLEGGKNVLRQQLTFGTEFLDLGNRLAERLRQQTVNGNARLGDLHHLFGLQLALCPGLIAGKHGSAELLLRQAERARGVTPRRQDRDDILRRSAHPEELFRSHCQAGQLEGSRGRERLETLVELARLPAGTKQGFE